jgi:hypothetical protein
MVLGVNVPHWLAGRQVKFTPAIWGSLATTAAIPAVALVSSAVGGGKEVLNVTVIAGAWYLGSPQATSTAIMPVVINRRVDWRTVTGWLRSRRACRVLSSGVVEEDFRFAP